MYEKRTVVQLIIIIISHICEKQIKQIKFNFMKNIESKIYLKS